jgi:hypothetical protein
VAAQSHLYLAHLRLVGLGQWLEPTRGAGGGAGGDGGRVTTPSPTSSLPWEEAAAAAENANAPTRRNTTHHENISDSLAHSAKELLHKHAGIGMQYGADCRRREEERWTKEEEGKRRLCFQQK